MPNPNEIIFTPELLERLRGAWRQAVTLKQGQFDFQGNVMVTDYAKFLIQFLDGKFAEPDYEQPGPVYNTPATWSVTPGRWQPGLPKRKMN